MKIGRALVCKSQWKWEVGMYAVLLKEDDTPYRSIFLTPDNLWAMEGREDAVPLLVDSTAGVLWGILVVDAESQGILPTLTPECVTLEYPDGKTKEIRGGTHGEAIGKAILEVWS